MDYSSYRRETEQRSTRRGRGKKQTEICLAQEACGMCSIAKGEQAGEGCGGVVYGTINRAGQAARRGCYDVLQMFTVNRDF